MLLIQKMKSINSIKEGYTYSELAFVIESWKKAIIKNKEVNKIVIVNSKLSGMYVTGTIIQVEKVSELQYKQKVIGEMFLVPTENNLEKVAESSMLYVPYFNWRKRRW